MKKNGKNQTPDPQLSDLGTVNALLDQIESLKSKYSLLSKAIDTSGQAIWIWNLTTGEIELNQAFYKITGFPKKKENPNFKWFLNILNNYDHPVFFQQIKKFINREISSLHTELRLNEKVYPGQWILIYGEILELDSKNNPVKAGGVITEITKSKAIENALREQINQANILNIAYNLQNIKLEKNYKLLNDSYNKIKNSEARFTRLANNLDEGVTIIEQNEIVFVNKALCQITGFSEAELKKTNGLELAIPEEKNRLINLLTEIKSNDELKKTFHEIEFWIQRKDGQKKYIRNILTPNFDDKGEIMGRYIFTSDFTNLKTAEIELKQSEEKFRMIFNHSPLGIFQFSPKGIIENINLEGCKILASSPEKLIGFDLINGSKNLQLQTGIKYLLQTNKNTFLEGIYTSVTGNRTAYLKAFFNPLSTQKGQLLGGICLFEDCSQSKQDEADLLETREKLRSTLDSLDDLVIVLDKENKFSEYFAPKWFLKKYTIPNGYKGLKINELPLDNTFTERISQSIHLTKATGKTQHVQLPLSINKTSYWISVKLSIRRDKDNKFNGLTVVIRDITELKKSEIKLAESEKQLRILIDHSPDLICLKNGQGQWIEANQTFRQLFNISNHFIGKTSAQIFKHNKEIGQVISYLEKNETQIWERGIPVRSDYILNFNGKNKIVFDFFKIPVFDEINNRLYIITIGRDITEKQKLTADLIKAKNKAIESDHLKSTFLANMSHEVRTPMNGIIGFAELLKNEGLENQERSQFIDIINRRAADLLHIIDDIIDISKIEASQLILHPRDCDAEKILIKLYENYREEISSRTLDQIKLSLHPIKKSRSIYTDSARLSQSLSYLINNAVKFTPEGFIEFGCYLTNYSIIFYVKDSGLGIPKTKLKLIFERFRQVEENPTRRYGGLGLGLNIAKRMVELMHGKIWVESEIGIGSTFYIQLPLDSEDYNLKNISDKKITGLKLYQVVFLHPEEGTKHKILNQKSEMEGIQPIFQKEMHSLFRYLKNKKADLLVIDASRDKEKTLQEINGIKQAYPQIPVIVIVQWSDVDTKELQNSPFITDYILAPFHTSELLFAIQSITCLKSEKL